jgi:hypothetical protein
MKMAEPGRPVRGINKKTAIQESGHGAEGFNRVSSGMGIWKQLDRRTAEHCRGLLSLHARAIWERFEEAHADQADSFVLLHERPDRVVIRIEDRCVLAEALRTLGSAAADDIDFADLPPDTIMVMVAPHGNVGAIVLPFGREALSADGTA